MDDTVSSGRASVEVWGKVPRSCKPTCKKSTDNLSPANLFWQFYTYRVCYSYNTPTWQCRSYWYNTFIEFITWFSEVYSTCVLFWGSRARAQGQLPPARAYETREGDIVSYATQHLCCQCITIILKSWQYITYNMWAGLSLTVCQLICHCVVMSTASLDTAHRPHTHTTTCH